MSQYSVTTETAPKVLLVAPDELAVVGHSVERVDGRAKVMGHPIFTGDVSLPGMLYGKVVRSKYAHALIRSIDVRAAASMEGVHAVLTAADIRGTNRYGIAVQDEVALAEDKVRYWGEAVALVAAETQALAIAAAERVIVDYEELTPVLTFEQALAPDAPRVHPNGNLLQHTTVRKGNIASGFTEADVIVENTYHVQRVDHIPMEPEVSLASIDTSGLLTIWTGCQYAFRDRRMIGKVLGMNLNSIRVVQMAIGGGYGRKDGINTEIHAGLLALATRRPVSLVSSREESMVAFTHRHPMRMTCKTGARRDGTLTAVEATVYADNGAYASFSPFTVKKAGLHIAGPYFVPNIKADTYAVYTNNPISGAMRGFGVVQAAVAHESQMDLLAAKLGMSPLEFRWRNALDVGLTTATGQAMGEGVGIKATLERIEAYMQEHGLAFHSGGAAT